MDFRRFIAAILLIVGSAAIVSSAENPFQIIPTRENPFKIERQFVIVQTVQVASRAMHYPTRLLVFKSRACGPCRDYENGALTTLVKKGKGWKMGYSEEYPIQIIDVDKNPELAVAYGVTQWPTTIALIRGKERRRRIGLIASPQEVFDLLRDDSPPASSVTVIQTTQTKTYPWRGQYLKSEFRSRDRMASHLVNDHGYSPDAVVGLSYESLVHLHDQAHGEQIR